MSDVPHMSAAEFRRQGHAVIDWIADYHERLESFPVLSQVGPGDVRAALPADPPEVGEPFADVLADIETRILPGVTHWQHPSFFAYFPANVSGPSILGDLLAAGLGVQGMLWATSPAATELETHVLDWLATLLDLPDRFRSDGAGGGVIQHSASDAALVALLAALHRVTDGRSEHEGVAGGRFAVYTSEQTHSSVAKACRIAGLGSDSLRLVDTDPRTLRARPDRLRALIDADRTAGVVPVLVVASIGTTGVGAVDPVAELAAIAHEAGAWLHVDAAWAGVAAVVPELHWLNDGLDAADSYATNPHKWLLTNFDCDAFWVADRTALVGALSILPEYLRNAATDSGAVVDYRDWQVPLGRRFRALKLWAVIRCYGGEGLRAHVRKHVALAAEFATWVRTDDRFELVAPPSLSLVTFRLRAGDDATRALMDAVNGSGEMYLTHTVVDGTTALRLAIGSPWTEQRHVRAAWELLRARA
ncbi:aromatic-L-amino-acid decarboxylase [Jatrophihabitans endophyticus]|uniref:Aromatic-L-amino-acid decarboxylase n=1 Tax=Jatrophihabitans endophyticus TaxID=1206085 RepID=A0A1M5CZA1_9ACTN|nr:pyridoxal-dependent decarboxylase [Jatrophihabitans endophyticus]SHF60153.1 aromatic-L-amino-acid decarboxylase [Jatrophihabitans endophyticus]